MRILAIVSGEYGQRHAENIRARGPSHWIIESWTPPAVLPPIVDYPEDFVPDTLPHVDLILSFAEHKGVAELLPEVARVTQAKAVIAAVDREAWLPRGLARQLRGWLRDMGVACVTPKPLCSLTESHYNVRQHQQVYVEEASQETSSNFAIISEFAAHFGQPNLRITVDPDSRTITAVEVRRDAFCGCAHAVAEGLIGVPVDEAEQKAGLLHHHYPCLAGMVVDPDFSDTVMHVSGNILKEQVNQQVRPYKNVRYIKPT